MKKQILLILLTLFPMMASAYDFEKDGLCYDIISLQDLTVAVAPRTTFGSDYKGDVVVPSEVEYNGRTLKVIAVSGYAFNSCAELNSVTLPPTIVEIKGAAFANTSSLTAVSLNEGLESIGINAFNKCKGLKSVVFPSTLKKIEKDAFFQCESLTSVTIPKGVEEIEDAFDNCFSLTDFKIEDSETMLIFSGFISYVTDLYMGRDLKSMNSTNGEYQFGFGLFPSIKHLTVGESVTDISPAHRHDVGMESITFRGSNPPYSIGFGNSEYLNCKISVPTGTKAIYQSTEPWSNFWNIEEYNVSAIRAITSESSFFIEKRFTLEGKDANSRSKGIIIIRKPNGESVKTICK